MCEFRPYFAHFQAAPIRPFLGRNLAVTGSSNRGIRGGSWCLWSWVLERCSPAPSAPSPATGNSSSKKGLTVELQHVIERVRGEFNEMPGLRLTPEQAARLWGLDAGSCNQVLRSLVSSSFLRWSAGSVVRVA
jgi:hypothetical protein